MANFPCSKCGECCKSLHLNPIYRELDRGDGICRNFEVKTRLCKAYDDRPLICRVEAYYDANLSDCMSKVHWYVINEQSCIALKAVSI